MEAKLSRQERRAAERLAKKAGETIIPPSEVSQAIAMAKSQLPGGHNISTKAIKKLLASPKAQQLMQQPEFAALAELAGQ